MFSSQAGIAALATHAVPVPAYSFTPAPAIVRTTITAIPSF